jgi:hypothetical protein
MRKEAFLKGASFFVKDIFESSRTCFGIAQITVDFSVNR